MSHATPSVIRPISGASLSSFCTRAARIAPTSGNATDHLHLQAVIEHHDFMLRPDGFRDAVNVLALLVAQRLRRFEDDDVSRLEPRDRHAHVAHRDEGLPDAHHAASLTSNPARRSRSASRAYITRRWRMHVGITACSGRIWPRFQPLRVLRIFVPCSNIQAKPDVLLTWPTTRRGCRSTVTTTPEIRS